MPNSDKQLHPRLLQYLQLLLHLSCLTAESGSDYVHQKFSHDLAFDWGYLHSYKGYLEFLIGFGTGARHPIDSRKEMGGTPLSY